MDEIDVFGITEFVRDSAERQSVYVCETLVSMSHVTHSNESCHT